MAHLPKEASKCQYGFSELRANALGYVHGCFVHVCLELELQILLIHCRCRDLNLNPVKNSQVLTWLPLQPQNAPFFQSLQYTVWLCLKVLQASGNGGQADSKATFGQLVFFFCCFFLSGSLGWANCWGLEAIIHSFEFSGYTQPHLKTHTCGHNPSPFILDVKPTVQKASSTCDFCLTRRQALHVFSKVSSRL